MNYLKLIRWQNLILFSAIQYMIYFGFLVPQNIPLALNHFEFFLLVLATSLIAAGGYVINNIHDVLIDEISKPGKVLIKNNFSETKAYNFYAILTILGVGLSFYLSNLVNKPNLTGLFIFTAISLFFYASFLKQTLLSGSVLVSLISSLMVLLPALYTLYPIIDNENRLGFGMLFKILLDFALIVMLLTFLREQLKDIASKDADYNHGIKSLPIILGVKRTAILCIILFVIILILVVLYLYYYLWEFEHFIAIGYVLSFVLTPLIYNLIQLFAAKSNRDFVEIARNLKYVTLTTVLTIWVINYNILLDVV